jgi:putative aminopeptidase FrvX
MNKKTLKKLMEMPGIPGHEQVVAAELSKKLKAAGFKVERDNLGSV